MNPRSPFARLLARPQRFGFDAAIRVLLFKAGSADPARAARFRSIPNFTFPPADITELREQEGQAPSVTTPVMGLIGPTGITPRYYTDMVAHSLRNRSRALHEFVDLLAQRLVAAFARAGGKYRPHSNADASILEPALSDPVEHTLLALSGFATPNLVNRLAAGKAPLLHYAGLFAARPRSADRLEALISDWVGQPVEVVQFAGSWLSVPPDQRSRLGVGIAPGAYSRLGIDAAIGVRAWDPQGRILLRIGPLTHAEFEALLPDKPSLREMISLVRGYVGFEIGFAVNPVIARAEIPDLRLEAPDAGARPGPALGPRLGWNTWLTGAATATRLRGRSDAADAAFEAELVEAQP